MKIYLFATALLAVAPSFVSADTVSCFLLVPVSVSQNCPHSSSSYHHLIPLISFIVNAIGL